ncbi:MAG: CpaF family protein, partial [Paracoccaceae bacterium]
MFSRFKKSDGQDKPAALGQVGSGAATLRAPAAAAKPVATARPLPTAAPPRPAAEVAAMDKEKKRKDRLSELKVELHKRLLDNLNLAALEHASEASLKSEIATIVSEGLEE